MASKFPGRAVRKLKRGLVGAPAMPPPVANFSASLTTGVMPLAVTFTDTSTGEPTAWSWEFFGAGLVQSTEASPTYTFREPGLYTVKMRATNAGGTSESVKVGMITVTDKPYAPRAASVSRYVEGVEDAMYQPNAERLTEANGAVVFDFTSVSPTAMTNCADDLYEATRWAPATQGRRLTTAAGGDFSAVFTVAAEPLFDATKNLVLKLWVSDVAAVNSFSIKLDNGSFNSQTWQQSGTGFKRGWNIIVLSAPNQAVARDVYSSFTGVSWIGTAQGGTPGMHNLPIKKITVALSGSASAMPAGTRMILDRLEVGSRVRPVLSFTFDQAGESIGGVNVFTGIILPMFRKYGFVGDARVHQSYASWNTPDAIAAGWGYNNGTFARDALLATTQEALNDYGPINTALTNAGLSPAEFGAAPGHNNGADASWAITALLQMGYPKFIRANGQRAIYHGTQGHGGRGNLFGVMSIDGTGYVAAAKSYVDGMLEFGGYGCLFSHTTASWGAQRIAEMEEILAYVRSKVDAGQIDCLPLSANGNQRSMARALLGYM